MKSTARGDDGPRRSTRSRPRTVATIIATAGMALLAAACGGSPGSHVAQLGSTTTHNGPSLPAAAVQQNGVLAFSHCMRSDGVPNYPDPNTSGELPKKSPQQLGVSSSQFQAAQRACQHLLPTASTAQQRHIAAQALEFSQCVRKHGVPNFPDPAANGRIPDPASSGIDQGSPQFQAANQACGKYRPPYMPSNAAYDAWARTNGS